MRLVLFYILVYLSVYLSVYLAVYLAVYLSVWLFYLYVCQSIQTRIQGGGG